MRGDKTIMSDHVIIIGSEFSHDTSTANYNRICAYKDGFIISGKKVVVISLTNAKNKGLSRNISLFNSNSTIKNVIKWFFFLHKFLRKRNNDLILFSDLHNRYAVILFFFRKTIKNSFIDIVEEPRAQLWQVSSSSLFKWYRPGHLYYYFSGIFKFLFYYNFYWKSFKIRFAISNNLKDLVENKAKKKVVIVPILFSETKVTKKEPADIDKKLFSHLSSNSLIKDGLDFLIKSFTKFNEKNECRLQVIGNISNKIKQQVNTNINNDSQKHIIYNGFIDDKALDFELDRSLATIICRPNNYLNKYNFPTRLVVYLNASRPVIMPGYGDYRIYFKDKVSAVFYEPENEMSFIEALKYVATCSDIELNKIGKTGKNLLSEHFCATNWCKKIIEIKEKERIS